MKNRLQIRYFVIFILFLCTSIAYGQEDKDENSRDTSKYVMLDEVIVTASRTQESVLQAPANVTVITEEQIKNSNTENIPELLEKHANINFKNSGNASSAVIDLRGFGGDNPYGKTLVLLNGRRLNRPDMSSINWLNIPIQQVQRIEVVRGANSVLYGDSAIGGVINIITKQGLKEIRTDVSASFGSNNTQTQRAGITGRKENLSFALNAQNQSSDGWRERTKFSSTGGGVNIGYDLTDTLIINGDISYNKTSSQLPGYLTKAQLEGDREQAINTDDDAISEYLTTSLSIEKIFNNESSFELKAIYDSKDIDSTMSSYSSYYKTIIDTLAVFPKFTIKHNFLGLQNKIITGVDLYKEKLTAEKYNDKEKNDQDSEADICKDTFGIYLKDDLNIKDDLIMSIGVRSEEANISGEEDLADGSTAFDSEVSFNKTVFDASLTKIIGSRGKIFGKAASLYKYPFLDEMVSYYGFSSDGFVDDLNPEKGISFEAGGNWNILPELNTSITVFNTELKDTISYNETSYRNENIGDTRHYGIEFSFSYNLKNAIYIYGHWDYHRAEFDGGGNDGKEVPLVPNNKISAGMEIPLFFDIYLAPEMQLTSSSYLSGDEDNNAEKLEGYERYDIYVRYQPQKRLDILNIKDISAYIGIKNIFDSEFCYYVVEETAYTPTAYYPAPGREFVGGVSFNF